MIGSFVGQMRTNVLSEQNTGVLNEVPDEGSLESVHDDPELQDAADGAADVCAGALISSVVDAVHKATGEDKEVLSSLLEDAHVEIFFDIKSRFLDVWLPVVLKTLASSGD